MPSWSPRRRRRLLRRQPGAAGLRGPHPTPACQTTCSAAVGGVHRQDAAQGKECNSVARNATVYHSGCIASDLAMESVCRTHLVWLRCGSNRSSVMQQPYTHYRRLTWSAAALPGMGDPSPAPACLPALHQAAPAPALDPAPAPDPAADPLPSAPPWLACRSSAEATEMSTSAACGCRESHVRRRQQPRQAHCPGAFQVMWVSRQRSPQQMHDIYRLAIMSCV